MQKEYVFDARIYSLEAVKRAAFDASGENKFNIEMHGDNIKVFSLNGSIDNLNFSNSVLDHQLRIEAENKFGYIRAILVAQAVAPHSLSKLDGYLKICRRQDDVNS